MRALLEAPTARLTHSSQYLLVQSCRDPDTIRRITGLVKSGLSQKLKSRPQLKTVEIARGQKPEGGETFGVGLDRGFSLAIRSYRRRRWGRRAQRARETSSYVIAERTYHRTCISVRGDQSRQD